MSTIRTTRKLTPAGWTDTVVATVSALVAIAVVALLLSATGGSRGSHAANHQTPAYYPLIQYRGTGAAPASRAGAHTTGPLPGTVRKSYGAVS